MFLLDTSPPCQRQEPVTHKHTHTCISLPVFWSVWPSLPLPLPPTNTHTHTIPCKYQPLMAMASAVAVAMAAVLSDPQPPAAVRLFRWLHPFTDCFSATVYLPPQWLAAMAKMFLHMTPQRSAAPLRLPGSGSCGSVKHKHHLCFCGEVISDICVRVLVPVKPA